MTETQNEWAGVVYATLARHPDWAATTVEAMQRGLTEALDRQRERVAVVSLGLVEALSTRPGAKRRVGQRVIDAIRQSNFHGSRWAAETIAKEEKHIDQQ